MAEQKKKFLTREDLFIQQPTQDNEGVLAPEAQAMLDRIERILFKPSSNSRVVPHAPSNAREAMAQSYDARHNHVRYLQENMEYLKNTILENPALLLAPDQEIFIDLARGCRYRSYYEKEMTPVMKAWLKDPQVLVAARQIEDIGHDLSSCGHYDILKVLMKDKNFVLNNYSSMGNSLVGDALFHGGCSIARGTAAEGEQEDIMSLLKIVLKDKDLRTQVNDGDKTILYECVRYPNTEAFAQAIKYDDLRLRVDEDGHNIALDVAQQLYYARKREIQNPQTQHDIAMLEGCLAECMKYQDLREQPAKLYTFEEEKPFEQIVLERGLLTQDDLSKAQQTATNQTQDGVVQV